MNPQPFDVFLIQALFGLSVDRRPCIILEEPADGRVRVALCSSAMDLYTSYEDFLIAETASDFSATGLLRTSYVKSGTYERDVELLVRQLGRLEGELLEDFTDWLG